MVELLMKYIMKASFYIYFYVSYPDIQFFSLFYTIFLLFRDIEISLFFIVQTYLLFYSYGSLFILLYSFVRDCYVANALSMLSIT